MSRFHTVMSSLVVVILVLNARTLTTSHCDINRATDSLIREAHVVFIWICWLITLIVRNPTVVKEKTTEEDLCCSWELPWASCRNALFQQIYVTVLWDVSARLLFQLSNSILRIVGHLQAMSTLIQINFKLDLFFFLFFPHWSLLLTTKIRASRKFSNLDKVEATSAAKYWYTITMWSGVKHLTRMFCAWFHRIALDLFILFSGLTQETQNLYFNLSASGGHGLL